MTDEHTTSSRRRVLRVAGTIGLGAVGLTGAASANGTGKQRRTNDQGKKRPKKSHEKKQPKKRPKKSHEKKQPKKRPKKGHEKKQPKKRPKKGHEKKQPKKDRKKNHQSTPDPVTETDKFVEHVRSEATKGVRK